MNLVSVADHISHGESELYVAAAIIKLMMDIDIYSKLDESHCRLSEVN